MSRESMEFNLSIPEIELLGMLLGGCTVHSQQAETLVGLKARLATSAKAFQDSLAEDDPPADPPTQGNGKGKQAGKK